MNEINEVVSPETQAAILQALAVASLLLPLAERLAARTANKIDDRIVGFIGAVLRLVPRISIGAKK